MTVEIFIIFEKIIANEGIGRQRKTPRATIIDRVKAGRYAVIVGMRLSVQRVQLDTANDVAVIQGIDRCRDGETPRACRRSLLRCRRGSRAENRDADEWSDRPPPLRTLNDMCTNHLTALAGGPWNGNRSRG